MQKIYIYVVDRDLGFAPNPFHGICTLATCKPRIRNTAHINDWIIGVGGKTLKATDRCVFAMKVSCSLTFNEYWLDDKYKDKKPVRNGSKKMMLGDNIYFHDVIENEWQQAISHHSNPDGTINIYNKNRDTQSKKVLTSDHFYYFGSSAPMFPEKMLSGIGYKNGRDHRVFKWDLAKAIIEWLEKDFQESLNLVSADPFNFDKSQAHYSVQTNKFTVPAGN